MTTANPKTYTHPRIIFPDIPERDPDDMTSAKTIHLNGKSHALRVHFSNRPNTIVDAEHYLSPVPTLNMRGIVYPDLLVAFDANQHALDQSNAYVISEQGKPPDFILEIASKSSRTFDRTTKRDTYARLAVPEYWRFDEQPTRNNPGLAGDRLVNGEYHPIPIDRTPEGKLRGYSHVLNLILEWQDGQLNWLDPDTEAPINTLEQEQELRLAAEARNRELEQELRRLRRD